MPDPTPEHLASLARVLDPANIKSRGYLAITPHEAAKALYAAVRTDPEVQDAMLAALAEGGRLVEEAANSPTVTPISFDRVSFMGGEDGCEAIVYTAGQTLTITRKVRLVEPEWRDAQ